MEHISLFIYGRPLWVIGVLMVYIPAMGAALGHFACETPAGKRHWKVLCALVLVVMLAVVIHMTLWGRETGEYGLKLMPLQSFAEAKIQPEYYRSMLMNVFLFVPLGMSAGMLLPEKYSARRRCVMSVLLCMGLSVLLEWMQFVLCVGWAETDDVICNTLGALVGSTALWLKALLARAGKTENRQN